MALTVTSIRTNSAYRQEGTSHECVSNTQDRAMEVRQVPSPFPPLDAVKLQSSLAGGTTFRDWLGSRINAPIKWRSMRSVGLGIVASANLVEVAALVRNNVGCSALMRRLHHCILGQPDIPTDQAVGQPIFAHGQHALGLFV